MYPRLMEVRGMLYELLSHCIPAALILRTLVEELLPMLDSQLKFEVIQWAAFYVSDCRKSRKV